MPTSKNKASCHWLGDSAAAPAIVPGAPQQGNRGTHRPQGRSRQCLRERATKWDEAGCQTSGGRAYDRVISTKKMATSSDADGDQVILHFDHPMARHPMTRCGYS